MRAIAIDLAHDVKQERLNIEIQRFVVEEHLFVENGGPLNMSLNLCTFFFLLLFNCVTLASRHKLWQ